MIQYKRIRSYLTSIFLFLVTNLWRKSLSRSRGMNRGPEELRFPRTEGRVSVKFLYWSEQCANHKLLPSGKLWLDIYCWQNVVQSVLCRTAALSLKFHLRKGTKRKGYPLQYNWLIFCSSFVWFFFSFYDTKNPTTKQEKQTNLQPKPTAKNPQPTNQSNFYGSLLHFPGLFPNVNQFCNVIVNFLGFFYSLERFTLSVSLGLQPPPTYLLLQQETPLKKKINQKPKHKRKLRILRGKLNFQWQRTVVS